MSDGAVRSAHKMIDRFLALFQKSPLNSKVDVEDLRAYIEESLNVAVPDVLVNFWQQCGSGYFGSKELFFFGSSDIADRDSLQKWNEQDFWRAVYPHPSAGGPVFFAENCFGEQIGFRWEGGNCKTILFIADTFEAFVLSERIEDFFAQILTDKDALIDQQRLAAVVERLGKLPNAMHYAPIVSPLFGGTADASNFAIETPNVHFRTAVANFQSKMNL